VIQNPSVPYGSGSSRHTDGVSDPHHPQYGPPPGYGPPGYGPPPAYGPPVYGPPVYGPPVYGPPVYGPPPGYPPPYGYGAPMAEPWVTARWPYGPGRPSLATAAVVLGHVTAGLTIVVTLIFVAVLLTGNGDPTMGALLLGLPCAIGMIVGGVHLTRRRSSGLLFASAATAVGVLVLSLIVGVGWLTPEDLAGQAVFVGTALPLPLLTAIFSRARTVTGWLGADIG
jgi:hypothetical protein